MVAKVSIHTWHERLGHIPYKTIRSMATRVTGLEIAHTEDDTECVCGKGV